MPAFTVERSIAVAAPIDVVYDSVRDFKQWKEWSPWVVAEPDCALEYAEDGSGYGWDGKIIGAGKMAVAREKRPSSLELDLTFLRPFKSKADVRMALAERDGGTHLTWRMNGSLPFFLFFLKKMMTGMIGMDYERGLLMLKDHVESGAVPVELEFAGEQETEPESIFGINRTTMISGLGTSLGEDAAKISQWLEEEGLEATGPQRTVYHRWKIGRSEATYTTGVPLKAKPDPVPPGFVWVPVEGGRHYVVRLTGPYRHVGNAWSAGMMHAQAKVFAHNRSAHPFEVYENDTGDPDSPDNVTAVHLRVKE